MNALETPLEALALNYLTYGFFTAVNNIWPLVAVLTAAVSFWRIRASTSPPTKLGSQDQDAALAPSAPAQKTATVSSAPITKTSFRMLEREGSTKTKFSLYYSEGAFGDGGEREDGGRAAVVVSCRKVERWCDDWERMMVMRMGDMELYKWQDRAALDGSVVRLWEGPRRRVAAALVVDGGVQSMIM